jgi:hypothetical protein
MAELEPKPAELEPMLTRVEVNEALGTVTVHYYITKSVNIITPNTKVSKEAEAITKRWWALGFTKLVPEIAGLGYGLKGKEWYYLDLRRIEILTKTSNPLRNRLFIALYVPGNNLPSSVPVKRVRRQI